MEWGGSWALFPPGASRSPPPPPATGLLARPLGLQSRSRVHIYIYIYTYIYIYVAAGHRVSRPRGTGSVGESVGEGAEAAGRGSRGTAAAHKAPGGEECLGHRLPSCWATNDFTVVLGHQSINGNLRAVGWAKQTR